ncbi:hypothetical protein MNAN1_003725 [Malassezia nana]|uniref:Ferric reductase NAD binding domain-containing protein n=1 Tax=Malassezia nana TaxID=180528 RepID=A0AAF0EUJ2_9BASI|nr:hypothetical protein MNAN1_003725 [Malassezia nana]
MSIDNSFLESKPQSHIIEKNNLALDQETREITAYLDGPYSHSYSLGMYEHAVLVAGGTGITFCLPQVMELLQRSVNGDPIITKSVSLIWMIQSFDMIRWIQPEMQQLNGLVQQSGMSIQMHVYAYRETIPYEENLHDFLQVHHAQRVDIPAAIDTEVSNAIEEKSKTMCIISCGPRHIVALVGNKVSSVNAKIAMGQLATLRDVRFVPELFIF